jgi:hypothetical protein
VHFWKILAIIAIKRVPTLLGSFTFLSDPKLAGGQLHLPTANPKK